MDLCYSCSSKLLKHKYCMQFIIDYDPKAPDRYLVKLMTASHQPLMVSESFANAADCEVAIQRARRAAQNVDNFVRWNIDTYRFNLYYGHGQLIGTGRYKSADERDTILNDSQNAILKAKVVNQTQSLRNAA